MKKKLLYTKSRTDDKNFVKEEGRINKYTRIPKTDKLKNELLATGKNFTSARSTKLTVSHVSEPRIEKLPAHEKNTEARKTPFNDFEANSTPIDEKLKQEQRVSFGIPVPPAPSRI